MKITFHEKYHNGIPAIEATNSTEEFHQLVSSIFGANRMDDLDYIQTSRSGAFFQGGSNKPEDGWILIECWKVNNARDFYEYLMNKWVIFLALTIKSYILGLEEVRFLSKKTGEICDVSGPDGVLHLVNRHGVPEQFDQYVYVPTSIIFPSSCAPRPGVEDGIIDTIEKFLIVYSNKFYDGEEIVEIDKIIK